LVGGGLNASIGHSFFEFDSSGLARSYVEHKINPFEGSSGGGGGVTDPIPFSWRVSAFSQAPRDDGFLALPIRCVIAHSELDETFPSLDSGVPQILRSGAADFRKGAPLPHAAQAQRDSPFVEYQRVAKYWLPEDFGYVGQFHLG